MSRTSSSRPRRRRGRPAPWLRSFIISVLLLAAATGGLLLVLRKTDLSARGEDCVQQVARVLQRERVAPGNLVRSRQYTASTWRFTVTYWEKEFQLPFTANLDQLPAVLEQAPELTDYTLTHIVRRRDQKRRELILEFRYASLPVYRVIWWQPVARGRLAIVLDDWGYSKPVFTASLALPGEITYAILPNLPYSREISETLARKGKEFILHLPLEPKNSSAIKLEQDTLLVSMPAAQLTELTRRKITSLPQLKGVNNHMGSLATEQRAAMDPIFAELKRHGLYFLDSMTSNSVCAEVAQRHDVPFLKRDIFLDNENDRDAITHQLKKARDVAVANGSAVAIGHARPLTIEVLAALMPQLAEEGILLVRASDLLSEH